jgi:predicted DNA-binding transcriptional regulator YafY
VKVTKNQTEQATLTAMYRAMDRQHPVTITYTKADGTDHPADDRDPRHQDHRQGDTILRAADRQTGELRTWRLDRIQAYTVHRTAYVVVLPETDRPAAPAPTTTAALVAFELARDEHPVRRELAPAA